MPATQITYSQLTRWRSECVQRFGKIHQLKIVRFAYDGCRKEGIL